MPKILSHEIQEEFIEWRYDRMLKLNFAEISSADFGISDAGLFTFFTTYQCEHVIQTSSN